MLSRLFIAPWLRFILIFAAPGFQFSSYAAGETEHTNASPYSLGKKTPDGLGLYYFGREIAHYMTHVGAPWLDRPERAAEERRAGLVPLVHAGDEGDAEMTEVE